MEQVGLVFDHDRRGMSAHLADTCLVHWGASTPRWDSCAVVLDCHDAELGPGAVNAHTHLYSGLAPLGMPPPRRKPESFVEILERVWWRLDRALDEASLRAAVRLYVAEALLSGTTTLIDHHESPGFIDGCLDLLAENCQELGMRALLCFGATERNAGPQEARRGLKECERFLRTNTCSLVRGAVGLHASFTVSDTTMQAAGALCSALGTIMHLHVAEAASDVADAKKRGYEGPLERLVALRALPVGSILAHGVHLSVQQVERAEALGCFLVHNPRSNRGNGVGYAASLRASTRVALGTDGYPANMAEEAAVLRSEAAAHHDLLADPGQRLEQGRALAARLFGVNLEAHEGAQPDLVAYHEPGRAKHVAVGGRLVVRDGQLLTGDIEAIRAHAREQATRLWNRLEGLGER